MRGVPRIKLRIPKAAVFGHGMKLRARFRFWRRWRFESIRFRSTAGPSGGLRGWRIWRPRLWGRQLRRRKIWRAKPSVRAIVEAVENSNRNVNVGAFHVRCKAIFIPQRGQSKGVARRLAELEQSGASFFGRGEIGRIQRLAAPVDSKTARGLEESPTKEWVHEVGHDGSNESHR